ncbi:MAG: PilZ domain-containing protein [Gammaproteobacteria bacterium]|nr:PilZ domain-containing protein [Gammaproteobacteria bacterium]
MFFKRNKNKTKIKHPYFMGTVNLLNDVLSAHSILSIRTTNTPGSARANSLLLKSSPDDGVIQIDSLVPDEMNRTLKIGTALFIHGSNNGTNFSFHAPIKEILKDPDGNTRYTLEFPKKLHSELQRDSFRVGVSIVKELKVTILSTSGKPLEGFLRDISATGFRVEFKGKPAKQFSSNDQMNGCLIQMPGGSKIECRAKIMHVNYNPDLDIYRLGCHFTELPGQGQRTINRFVNNMQREARRKEQGEDFI